MADRTTIPPQPRQSEQTTASADPARLAAAIEMLSRSVDHLGMEFASMRADFNTLWSEARTDFNTLWSEARGDFNTLRSESRGDFNTLRSEARTDFRLTFGALIATAIGLAGLIAKGFHWF